MKYSDLTHPHVDVHLPLHGVHDGLGHLGVDVFYDEVQVDSAVVVLLLHGRQQSLDAFEVSVPRGVQLHHVLVQAPTEHVQAVPRARFGGALQSQARRAVHHLHERVVTLRAAFAAVFQDHRLGDVEHLQADLERLQDEPGGLEALGQCLAELSRHLPEGLHVVERPSQALFVLERELVTGLVQVVLVSHGEERGEELRDGGFDVDVRGQHGFVAVVQVDVLPNVEVQISYGTLRR